MAKGSTEERSGSWYAIYRNGSGRQVWVKAGKTKRSAEILLRQRLVEIDAGNGLDIPKIKFKDYAKKWLQNYAAINVKSSTLESYESIIRLHLNPCIGEKVMSKITARELQEIISQKITSQGLSPKTVINIIVPLKEMFSHALEWGYIRNNPTLYLKRPRLESKDPDFLDPTEIKLFLKAISPEYFAFFFTAVMTGMRRGELLGLKWSDVNWPSGQIFVQRSLYKGRFTTPKSKGSRRKIVMTPALQYVLAQHRENSGTNETGLVFTSTAGTALDPDNIIKRQFHPALERAGLRRIRFHDLRHSYCAMLIGLKENIKFIQMQMGHSSATITLDRYGHLMNDDHHEFAQRLDKIMLGKSVRKLLENGGFEAIPDKKETPEALEPQELKSSGGGGI